MNHQELQIITDVNEITLIDSPEMYKELSSNESEERIGEP